MKNGRRKRERKRKKEDAKRNMKTKTTSPENIWSLALPHCLCAVFMCAMLVRVTLVVGSRCHLWKWSLEFSECHGRKEMLLTW